MTVVVPGDHGKPRPALVIQNERTVDMFDSITVCLMTTAASAPNPLRLAILPEPENGLREPTYVQVDKIHTPAKRRVRGPIGQVTDEFMLEVDLALAFHLRLFASA